MLPLQAEAMPAETGGSSRFIWSIAETFLALLLFIAALPFILLAALVVWILSRRAPFVTHRRAGQNGKPLPLLKLRTMWPAPAGGRHFALMEPIRDESGPSAKAEDDARVANAFARFCRVHSIDELPQLWHVVCGQMSLVGPRPLTFRELREHYGADADEILRAKPGITGLWQVSGRNRLTYEQRRQFDLRLVREASPRLTLFILRRTLGAVLTGRDAW